VSPKDSEVRILVHRGGRLAVLGHNHVVTSRDLEGFVRIEDQAGSGRADLLMPVATLMVDDPVMRAQAGPEFPPDVSSDAIEATRHNLLGPVVLHGARYPYVRVTATLSGAAPPEVILETALTVRDVTYRTRVPARLQVDEERLEVEGEVALRQTDLGLTPYSALAGALAVEDALPVRFHVVAKRLRGVPPGERGTP
jgi:hypothetical protein